jgi:hypothetical protein
MKKWYILLVVLSFGLLGQDRQPSQLTGRTSRIMVSALCCASVGMLTGDPDREASTSGHRAL